MYVVNSSDNDPSAGSPTETLLRLLLPLDGLVWPVSRRRGPTITAGYLRHQSRGLTKSSNR